MSPKRPLVSFFREPNERSNSESRIDTPRAKTENLRTFSCLWRVRAINMQLSEAIREAIAMKLIMGLGVVLALLGVLGLAIPVFTTSHTEDVVKLGDLKIQNTEQSAHVIPQALSVGALLLGVVFIGAGLYQKR